MMFGFGKNKSQESSAAENAQPGKEKRPGLFGRLKAGLSKTRSGLTEGIATLVVGRKQIDDELLEDLETQLLTADVGVEATRAIIDDLTQRASRKQLKDSEWFELRHDAFVSDPKESLRAICAFLGTDVSEDYLDDCSSIVFELPHKTRHNVEWNSHWIDVVKKKIDQYPFLEGYSYAD